MRRDLYTYTILDTRSSNKRADATHLSKRKWNFERMPLAVWATRISKINKQCVRMDAPDPKLINHFVFCFCFASLSGQRKPIRIAKSCWQPIDTLKSTKMCWIRYVGNSHKIRAAAAAAAAFRQTQPTQPIKMHAKNDAKRCTNTNWRWQWRNH